MSGLFIELVVTRFSEHFSDSALTTAPGSTRNSIGESSIQPARYHDSRGCTAEIHADKALIVECTEFIWGACMVRDPASEWSITGSNCTVEGARLFSSCSGFGGTGSVMFSEGARLLSGNSVIFWVSTDVVCVFLISFCGAAGCCSPVALIKFWREGEGEGEDERSQWWILSLRWVVRISPQGSSRFPYH